MNGSVKMQVETLQSCDIEELYFMVDKFTTGRITYDVIYLKVRTGWQANIFYDDINEEV